MDIVTYALLNGKIKNYDSNVDEWLEENVDPDTGYVLDRSLQMENAAAPADMVGDINDEVGDLKNTLNHKADVIYDTTSGDIASFPDGADGLPVKDLTVGIEPVQSGTGDPSPTNVRPISGWTGANVTRTGKNLFNKMAYTKQGWFLWTPNPFRKLPVGQAISFSINKIDSESHGFSTTTNAAIGGPAIGTFAGYGFGNEVFTVTTTVTQSIKDALYFQLNGNWNGLTADMVDNAHFQIEINASPTAYEPYSGTTIPISWQSSAGTVYAASLDALAGSLKVRPYYASYNGETLVGPWISSMDVYTPGGTPTTGAQVVDFGGLETSYSLDAIALNTFLGQNNILADCGPVSVEYQADTKLYIQKINAPTDDDMIADAQIASGKYFIVNNNLYLSTAAILAGDPIKPGTNCTLTNLAAALNAINS